MFDGQSTGFARHVLSSPVQHWIEPKRPIAFTETTSTVFVVAERARRPLSHQ
jgi:hypothetical protein